jgi:prepilin-type processing-associated H-X9-DG protein
MKYAELENPAVRYVFLEEPDIRGTLPGSWQMNPGSRTWVDPVTMWHDRKTTLGFADGHAETHAWRDKSFIDWNLQAMYSPAVFTFNMMPPADERNDIDYMAKGFPYKSLR